MPAKKTAALAEKIVSPPHQIAISARFSATINIPNR
jgi:hypothetical protein